MQKKLLEKIKEKIDAGSHDERGFKIIGNKHICIDECSNLIDVGTEYYLRENEDIMITFPATMRGSYINVHQYLLDQYKIIKTTLDV